MIFVELVLLAYFSYVSLYSFILSLAGLFYQNRQLAPSPLKRKIAVLIPSYKEDQVIVSVAISATKQLYPKDKFDVVVIADSLKATTLEKLRALHIKLIEVSFEKSTKVKALNRAMDVIGNDYDCALILDADNIMEENFLEKMNSYFTAGYRAVQGQRAAKNRNTSMAVLDGLSETINNFIYRQGSVSIGLSSSLIGSGMIFEYAVLKDILLPLNSIGGFDRELELDLIRRGIKIYYAKDTIVYDEKVESTEVFEKQRTRWLSSQFLYLRKYFSEGCLALLKGKVNFFNCAILKNIQLPRLLNLGMLTILTMLSFAFAKYLNFTPYLWLLLLTLCILSMLFAIPRKLYSWEMLKSILLIPGIFFKMFLLLFKLKGANKTFIHTPHTHQERPNT
jgi:cellulose synthase/poly-beta-1,6-N-acetylglucosamine synthase-like glycosyltransferase